MNLDSYQFYLWSIGVLKIKNEPSYEMNIYWEED